MLGDVGTIAVKVFSMQKYITIWYCSYHKLNKRTFGSITIIKSSGLIHYRGKKNDHLKLMPLLLVFKNEF